jgi:hypothetical protein
MQSRGPLMIEHRLIERIIVVIKDALMQIENTRKMGRRKIYFSES